MRIAITGGTGVVGRHLANALVSEGHEVTLVARGMDRRDLDVRNFERTAFAAINIADEKGLAAAFSGCGFGHCFCCFGRSLNQAMRKTSKSQVGKRDLSPLFRLRFTQTGSKERSGDKSLFPTCDFSDVWRTARSQRLQKSNRRWPNSSGRPVARLYI